MIRNDEERHQLTGTVQLPEGLGRELEVAFDFKGNILNPVEWEGSFYLRGKDVEAANWGIKPEFKGIMIQSGAFDLQLWGNWHKGKINTVSGHMLTRELGIKFQKNKLD